MKKIRLTQSWEYMDDIIKGARGPEIFIKKRDDILSVYVKQTSASRYDWITNFSCMKASLFGQDISRKIAKVKCHYGFLSYANIVLYRISDYISEDIKTIRLFGSSQGGAVAVVLAGLLSVHNKKISVATWCAPAVGNKAFREYTKKCKIDVVRHYRLFDVVVHAPYWLVGLHHVGRKLRVCNGAKEAWQIVTNHARSCKDSYVDLGIKDGEWNV